MSILIERYGTNFLHLNLCLLILIDDAGVGSGIGSHTTGVERTERQLSTRLTNSLCSDDTDSLTLLYHTTGSEVTTITLAADALLRLTGQHRTNLDALNLRLLDGFSQRLGDFLTGSHDNLTSLGINHIVNGNTSEDTLRETANDLIAILQGGADKAAQRTAVLLVDNHVVRDVNETTSQVTGVSRLHGGVGQTLTGTVSRDEVLQHGHTLLEVRQNGVLNNLVSLGTGLLRLSHQTTDTGELLNLVLTTTGTGVEHHEHGVEALVGLGHLLQQNVTDVIVDMGPGIDNLVVTLVIGDEAHVIVVGNLTNLLVTLGNEFSLLLRDDDVIEVERQTSLVSHTVTKVLDTIEEFASLGETDILDDGTNNVAQRLLVDNRIDEAYLLGNNAVDNHTTNRGFHHVADRITLLVKVIDHHLHQGVQIASAFVVGDDSFLGAIERQTLAQSTRTDLSDIIESEHHIL